MTGAWLTGAWIATAAALIALAAAWVLIAARERVAMIACLALVGAMGAVAQTAVGGADAGFALMGVTALLTLMGYATGALTGDAVARKPAPQRVAIAVAAVALCALVASWPLAPAALWHGTAPQAPAFDMARADDLFLALAALVGVAATAAALLGFGERGVIGADGKSR
jgi:hypothetical protein